MEDDSIPMLVTSNFTPDANPIVETKIPVTILTGFLGAGKSTLLKRVLQERHGMRIAVIMNELGTTGGVEEATVWSDGASADEWISVENGCLCCTARNETILALESLILRKPDIDQVLIEASGAADPTVLAERLWLDEQLESRLVLDAVVCVVDGSSVAQILEDSSKYEDEAARQIAIADIVILNKMDIVNGTCDVNETPMHSTNDSCLVKLSGSQPKCTISNTLVKKTNSSVSLETLTLLIEQINPIAKIIPAVRCNVQLNRIFAIGEYESETISKRHLALENVLASVSIGVGEVYSKKHSSQIWSFTVNRGRPFESVKVFERWLFILLWERFTGFENNHMPVEEEILRIKGIVYSQDGGFYALQVVRDKYELNPLIKNKTMTTTLIFIGRMSEATRCAIHCAIQSLK